MTGGSLTQYALKRMADICCAAKVLHFLTVFPNNARARAHSRARVHRLGVISTFPKVLQRCRVGQGRLYQSVNATRDDGEKSLSAEAEERRCLAKWG